MCLPSTKPGWEHLLLKWQYTEISPCHSPSDRERLMGPCFSSACPSTWPRALHMGDAPSVLASCTVTNQKMQQWLIYHNLGLL